MPLVVPGLHRVTRAGDWTLGRLSLQGGLRFEHLSDYFPEQRMGPNRFLPTAVSVTAPPGTGADLTPLLADRNQRLGQRRAAGRLP